MNRLTAIAIYALLIGAIAYLVAEYIQSEQNLDQAQQNQKALQSETNIYKGEAGRWKAKALAAEGNVKTLEVTHSQQIDSLESLYSTKIKNIQASVTTENEFNVETNIKPDSISRLPSIGLNDCPTIHFRDINKWYQIIGSANCSNVALSLSVYDSINYTVLYRRERFWKAKSLYIESTSFNPYTRVNSLQSFTKKESDPGRFGLSIVTGVGLTSDLRLQPTISAGFSYTIWRF